ncbi:MAG: ATP-binding protein [Anaerolineales bacterium]|nr:ATP-binding protein [Anaerolineales bacterium]
MSLRSRFATLRQPNGKAQKAASVASPAFPGPSEVGPTEPLVDVTAFVGEAIVLDNGSFVRGIEVAPIDLERGDPAARQQFWGLFATALRRLRAPMAIQLVIVTQPQDLAGYLDRWHASAVDWQQRAEAAVEPETKARRQRMQGCAEETAAFLTAAHEQLSPRQQRYLVVIAHNPFPEAVSGKRRERVLSELIVKAALEQLEEYVQVATSALTEIGLQLRPWSPARLSQALWDHYHHSPNLLGTPRGPGSVLSSNGNSPAWAPRSPVDQCPQDVKLDQAARDPEKLADLLAPALIEEHEHYLRVGEVVARGYLLYDFDPRAPVDLAAIVALPLDTTHALYLTAADPVQIRQQFKETETELKASTLVDARRGAITDWGRQAAIQSVEAARAELEIALQAPYFLHWYVLVWANDLAGLDRQCREFETALKVKDIRFYPATRRHLSVLQSTRPLARPAYKLKPRNMSAESLGSFFPFVRREYLDPEGWHFGLHRGNGLFVALNPFERGQSNASELVIGAPGGGKSVYLKQAIETVLALGHRVFVIDPEREYLRLAIDFHAPYVELGKHSEPKRLELPAGPEGYRDGLVALGELYEALSAAPLAEIQVQALTQSYQAVCAAAGILPDQPATWSRPVPPLAALVSALAASGTPDAQELARVLRYAEALTGGQVLNIMDLNLASENPWTSAAESLAAFVEAILGEHLDAPAFNALVECYQTTMEKWGFRADDLAHGQARRAAPTLSALVDTLTAHANPRSQALAQVLLQYAYGLYADLFNQPTTVDVGQAPLVVFGMRSLRENVERTLAPVFAWQVLRLVWNEVVAGGAAQPVHLFIDEAWYLLEQPGAAHRLERMARSFRKYNAALHLATQDTHRLVSSPEARVIAEIARIKMLFGQESDSAVRRLGDLFGLSPAEQSDLLHVRKGEGLLLFGNDVRLPLYVAVNPLRLARLATNREQQQAVAIASGRRAEPIW